MIKTLNKKPYLYETFSNYIEGKKEHDHRLDNYSNGRSEKDRTNCKNSAAN